MQSETWILSGLFVVLCLSMFVGLAGLLVYLYANPIEGERCEDRLKKLQVLYGSIEAQNRIFIQEIVELKILVYELQSVNPPPTPEVSTLAHLRQAIESRLSSEEVELLIFDLGYSTSNMSPVFSLKIIDLLKNLERDGRLPELKQYLKQTYKGVKWPDFMVQ